MLNKVMIIGRLGRDPEVRYTPSGTPVCSLNVATDESYIDRDGKRVEGTEWHRVSVFQRTAENCGKYLAKGSLVYVEGSLATRKWQDKDGQDRYTTEIKAQRVLFLDRRSDAQPGGSPTPYDGQQSRRAASDRNQNVSNKFDMYSEPDDTPSGVASASYDRQQSRRPASAQNQQNSRDNDFGPAFPSESPEMDDVPF